MTVFVDADACPVTTEAVQIAQAHGVKAVLLCDTSHEVRRPGAETIVVSKGADSVDYALVNRLTRGDVAVTQDYGLAAMCLARGAYVINQNGLVYNETNIGLLLEQRAAAAKQRRAGKHGKGPAKRTFAQTAEFCRSFEKLLATAGRAANFEG